MGNVVVILTDLVARNRGGLQCQVYIQKTTFSLAFDVRKMTYILASVFRRLEVHWVHPMAVACPTPQIKATASAPQVKATTWATAVVHPSPQTITNHNTAHHLTNPKPKPSSTNPSPKPKPSSTNPNPPQPQPTKHPKSTT
jgi:hypothetical protein